MRLVPVIHYDCLGMSLSNGLRLGTSKNGFISPHCFATTLGVHENNFREVRNVAIIRDIQLKLHF